jgi:formylmethanofuran dehydrogenase subunit C
MKGGVIRILGSTDRDVGFGMIGGEIHVEGAIGSIGNIRNGKIYHKGKLIVDK